MKTVLRIFTWICLGVFWNGCSSPDAANPMEEIFSSSAGNNSVLLSSSAGMPFQEESGSVSAEMSSSADYPHSSNSTEMAWDSTPNGIPYLKITTNGDVKIEEDYVLCSIRLNGNGVYENFSADSVKIRQRGNSTRIYYDKKPYRIKLPVKQPLLGLSANKDWVLLANYRDPTGFMNALAFDIAREMGNFAFVNSNRFVDVELNGEYIGLYQLTEQVERAKSRVNIGVDGVLLSLDVDDGPEESPAAGNNFISSVYRMPVAVKYPKNPDGATLDSIREDFAVLESLIHERKIDSVKTRLDVSSYIDFILLQEITRNVELAAPRSMYLYKEKGKYYLGPVWDFDGGFAFDWASMTDGHNYFSSQTFLFENAVYKNSIPGFFSDLFKDSSFAADYESRWKELQPQILTVPFQKLDACQRENFRALKQNVQRWPIGKDFEQEIVHLKNWLEERVRIYTGTVPTEETQNPWMGFP